MLRIFSSPAYCLIGVGLFVGISVYRTSRAYAQDASAASVAELQQRLQDLEAEVRQLKTGRGPNPASAETVSLPSVDPVAAAATSANPGADHYIPVTPNDRGRRRGAPLLHAFHGLE